MHRSRLTGFVIDCRTGDIEAAAKFWGEALGRPVKPAEPDYPTYRALDVKDEEPLLLIQSVDHDSRIHLDIETDDMEAEVARLEKLGAKKIEFRKRWWVMEAPTGHRFCVVRPQRGPLEEQQGTNEWK